MNEKNMIRESILVTGASGTLGSAIIRSLSGKSTNTYALYRNSSQSNSVELPGITMLCKDSNDWPNVVEKLKPEALILCDWQGVGGKERDDYEIQQENVARWNALIESAIRVGVSRIIAFGSQAEISNEQRNVSADVEFSPRGTYGEAKALAYQNLKTKCQSARINFDWVRVFSLYGDNKDKRWLIPQAVNFLAKGEPISLTNCQQVWNFLHIDDAASAVVAILQNESKNGVINLANPESIKLRNVLDFIGKKMDRSSLLRYGAIPYPPEQVMCMEPNVEELCSLGWMPRVNIFESLDDYISSLIGKQNE